MSHVTCVANDASQDLSSYEVNGGDVHKEVIGESGRSRDRNGGNVVNMFTSVPYVRLGKTYASLSSVARHKTMSSYIPCVSQRASLDESTDKHASVAQHGGRKYRQADRRDNQGARNYQFSAHLVGDDSLPHPHHSDALLSGLLRTFRGCLQLVIKDFVFVRDCPAMRMLP